MNNNICPTPGGLKIPYLRKFHFPLTADSLFTPVSSVFLDNLTYEDQLLGMMKAINCMVDRINPMLTQINTLNTAVDEIQTKLNEVVDFINNWNADLTKLEQQIVQGDTITLANANKFTLDQIADLENRLKGILNNVGVFNPNVGTITTLLRAISDNYSNSRQNSFEAQDYPDSSVSHSHMQPRTAEEYDEEVSTYTAEIIDRDNLKIMGDEDAQSDQISTLEHQKLEALPPIKEIGTGLELDDNGSLNATGGGDGANDLPEGVIRGTNNPQRIQVLTDSSGINLSYEVSTGEGTDFTTGLTRINPASSQRAGLLTVANYEKLTNLANIKSIGNNLTLDEDGTLNASISTNDPVVLYEGSTTVPSITLSEPITNFEHIKIVAYLICPQLRNPGTGPSGAEPLIKEIYPSTLPNIPIYLDFNANWYLFTTKIYYFSFYERWTFATDETTSFTVSDSSTHLISYNNENEDLFAVEFIDRPPSIRISKILGYNRIKNQ